LEIIPAIDLKDGQCVRLYQGDFDRVTVFGGDPAEVAQRWEEAGTERIHVVDLDGARVGRPINLEVLSDILSSVKVPVQAGGGIRSRENVRQVLGMGVERVVLGTAAVEDARLVVQLCTTFGEEAIVVSVDAREGMVAIHGWRKRTEIEATTLVKRMGDLGVRRFVYTDVARDGTLTEPNFAAIERLVNETEQRVIAAGGISSVAHLTRLASLGVEGAIVGRALYTGDIDLREALEATRRAS